MTDELKKVLEENGIEDADQVEATPPKKAAKRKTAKRGRPKGAKTKDRVVVHSVPEICPKCGSRDLKKFEGSKVIERPFSGTASNGETFSAKVWRKKVCQDCGQHVAVIEAIRDPTSKSRKD